MLSVATNGQGHDELRLDQLVREGPVMLQRLVEWGDIFWLRVG
jgi:hypothetical protein